MAVANIHDLAQSEYLDVRNNAIKPLENAQLFGGTGGNTVYMDDPNNPSSNAAIGYGWDLRVNGASTTVANLNSVGITLTAQQIQDLNNYATANPTVTSAQLLNSWANIVITEQQATDLLNVAAASREAELTNHLGNDDIPYSGERAAIFSHIYNLGVNGIPTTTRLIETSPSTSLEEFGQRAEIWWEIAYNSNSLGQPSNVIYGLQVRRHSEANSFGLHAEVSDLTHDEQVAEAKFVYQFLDTKNQSDALRQYNLSHNVPQGQADAYIAQHYNTAFLRLVAEFGFGQQIDDYRHVYVDGSVHVESGVTNTGVVQVTAPDTSFDAETFFGSNTNQRDENHLIFMEGGNDTVFGDYGNDYIDGGENSDDSADIDTLTYENLTSGVHVSVLQAAAGSTAAIFRATDADDSTLWEDHFTNFETVRLTDLNDFSELSEEFLNQSGMTIDGRGGELPGEAGDLLSAASIQGQVTIDLAGSVRQAGVNFGMAIWGHRSGGLCGDA